MATLYELTRDYVEIENALMECEQDISYRKLLASDLENAGDAFKAKAENYAKLIKNLEAEEKALDEEERRLKARRMTVKNNLAWLKTVMKDAMKLTGNEKFTQGVFKFSIRKNGGKEPVILDVPEDHLPDELVKVIRKADNEAIREYIAETGDITYAHIGERGDSLSIR